MAKPSKNISDATNDAESAPTEETRSIPDLTRMRLIKLDEPTNLPDGAEVQLVIIGGDDLDDEERAALHESVREGIEDMEAGRTVDARTAIAELL